MTQRDADPKVAPERRRRRDTMRQQRKVRRRRSFLAIALSVLLLGGAVWVAAPFVKGLVKGAEPTVTDYPAGGTGEQVTVTIPEGATGADMGKILHDADVVLSAQEFTRAFAANDRSSRIQPGTYTLRTKMSAAEAVSALLDPVNRADAALTIPEGFEANQVYERVAAQLSLNVDDVKAAAADGEAIGLPSEAGGNPEGWFAAQTYSFAPETNAVDALKEMIDRTVASLEKLKIPRDQWQAVLTKASIVEREVPRDYYGQAARVIENRLADTAGPTLGKLQMDSTVLYGLGKRGGVPSSEEVRQDTPYNTYVHSGLPPTPIGAPSEEAIKAVMNPPAGDWLYFVTVNLDTGETLFTGSFEEHKANIEKLRAWREEHPNVQPSATTEE